MRWTQKDFTDLAARAASRYESENKWWKWGDPATYVSHAWLMYCRANENTLGMLLLGDAKIRTSRDLLMNFGVASGGGLYDKQELKQAEDLMGGLDMQLKDVPAKTALMIFALGVLTGRLLSKRD